MPSSLGQNQEAAILFSIFNVLTYIAMEKNVILGKVFDIPKIITGNDLAFQR